jgi:Domain of unknown function DUF11
MGITTRRALCILVTTAAVATMLMLAVSAAAASPAPHWLMASQPAPTYFHASDTTDFYEIVALNDGGAATTGEIKFEDTLPAGLVATSAEASAGLEGLEYGEAQEMTCAITGDKVACNTESSVPVNERVIVKIDVEVPANASGMLVNEAMIAGGGATNEAKTSNTTPVVEQSQVVPYGVGLTGEVTEEDGQLTTQAGAHPFAFSTMLAVNIGKVNGEEECQPPTTELQDGCAELSAPSKDIEVQLPPGMVGNPLAVPRCSQARFQESGGSDLCPASTQVGDLYVAFYGSATAEQYAPVYNVEPPPGQPAELGFTIAGQAHIPMFFHVRSEGDYGLTTDLHEISTFDAVRFAALTIWGVPAAEAHNPMRESKIDNCEPKKGVSGCGSEDVPAKPFLTMPSSCSGGALDLPLTSDSWVAPGAFVLGSPEVSLPAMTGCESLSFSPDLSVGTSTVQQGAPAGYTVNLKVPQKEGAEELAAPDVRDVEVAMPEGTAISPSAANGLVACSNAEFGLKSGVGAKCPNASNVGTVKISTPLLAQPLTGEVFVGQPECAPCSAADAEAGRMVPLFIQAQGSGVLIKLAGHTKINNATGRLTTVFTENPQLPFEELELTLENGPRAPLTNPTVCGPAVAVAKLTPWSSLTASTTSAANPPSMEGCAAPKFTPGIVAGMTSSARGGSFSPMVVTLTRADGQQDLGAVTLHLPPGLAGILAKVPLCAEAQANAGTCAAASQIGEVSASVGAGSQPYTIHGGKVYLTGPYGGGPFGLSIMVPAEAGPYKLAGVNGAGGEGDGTVVIRGSIKVDPKTAAITITTNPPPTQLDGIPLHLQKINVNVNREGFMFNPTNCNAMSVEGTLTSSTGTVASASYPFQAVNCATLPFKPGFKVRTHARHTKRFGAYLHVGVTSGNGQANIKSVFVELPKVLPSREETLKQACTEKQFAENPAGCPTGSHVGTAVAHTPVLPVPLTGPAIFVSHGGAAFPDLDVVLQGDGVTVDLTGNTNIVKGITTSDFKSVPDVPVSSFELTLPGGTHSALAATANLCTRTVTKHKHHVKQKRKLVMPTTITGQNGAVVKQSTVIAVEGCGGSKGKAAKGKSKKKH